MFKLLFFWGGKKQEQQQISICLFNLLKSAQPAKPTQIIVKYNYFPAWARRFSSSSLLYTAQKHTVLRKAFQVSFRKVYIFEVPITQDIPEKCYLKVLSSFFPQQNVTRMVELAFVYVGFQVSGFNANQEFSDYLPTLLHHTQNDGVQSPVF